MIQVQFFSQGSADKKNEDHFGHDETSFVIADGATDKSGRRYDLKTGGELVSRLVVKEALASTLNGKELVDFLNKKVNQFYEELGITEEIKDPKYRFTCGFIAARIVEDKIYITYLGDLGFRINGSQVYKEIKQVDIDNAEERSRYIRETNDIEGSRAHSIPFILKQFEHQNNPKDPLGYGVIDGTKTPAQFIKTFEYPLDKIETIELFTDGYFAIPQKISIAAWEKAFEKAKQEDPDNWKQYKSTKSHDDRTIAILSNVYPSSISRDTFTSD